MRELIPVIEKPELPEHWNYGESVMKFKNLFKEVREKGNEALNELYFAYRILKEDSKKKIERKFPNKTFASYCKDIKITEKTGYRWLHKYFNLPRREILTNVSIPTRIPALIRQEHCIDFLNTIDDLSVDLLLTDPPYMTDVDNIEEFANNWIPLALNKVKDTGRIYIFAGAYSKELKAYINVLENTRFILDNILVWTYENTLGPSLKMGYKLNWQAIFYLYGTHASDLNCDCDSLPERFTVQKINAPDGRFGDKYGQKRISTWQKPIELAERLIEHSTKEGDFVIDPFAGTGTFLLAAGVLGRKNLGCEIDDEMIEIAKERGCEIV